jgi:hypothetical protein
MHLLVDLLLPDADREGVVLARLFDDLETLRLCKAEGALAGEHDMPCGLHHASGDRHRVDDITDAGDGSRRALGTIHDRRIEFDITRRIRSGSPAGDVQPRCLHLGDRVFDHVECPGAGGEPIARVLRQLSHVVLRDRVITAGPCAGTAMQCE